jgi:uncharacterized protein Yka (UPF0111/DUF47 family)
LPSSNKETEDTAEKYENPSESGSLVCDEIDAIGREGDCMYREEIRENLRSVYIEISRREMINVSQGPMATDTRPYSARLRYAIGN